MLARVSKSRVWGRGRQGQMRVRVLGIRCIHRPLAQTRTNARKHSHIHTRAQTHTHMYMKTRARTHAHTSLRAIEHTRTHTYTHVRACTHQAHSASLRLTAR